METKRKKQILRKQRISDEHIILLEMVGEYDCVQLFAKPRSCIQPLFNKNTRTTETNKVETSGMKQHSTDTCAVFWLHGSEKKGKTSSRCIVIAML